jgi:hypothetical protein
MANRFQSLRDFFERLVFAGLKPDAPAGPRKSKLKSLIASAEDLAGRGLKPDEATPIPPPASLRRKLAIGAGVLVLLGGVYGLAIVLQRPAERKATLTSGGPILPLLPPGFKVEKNKDLAVEEIEFKRTGEVREITGRLRNLTDKNFAHCEVSFDVTTRQGTQLGGVTTTVQNLPPRGVIEFRIPVPQKEAGFAMVRELRTD